ncbi:alpha/beta fold hydrolase [Nocardia sp. CA-135398]|uniref:alpha/beta fold hydrolase n=1 Tax=Nocardia sp. CA-135398 TaxID=3239977 RepID=UPI003D9829B0
MPEVERPTQIVELSTGPVEYRLDQRGAQTVLVLHGGHMRASVPLGEEVFVEAGYTVLAPSRPGYGRTPLSTGTFPEKFAGVIAELCHHLGIERLAAVVGQSAGGPTALVLASTHASLVERLILESAVGFLAWPDRRTRLGGHLVFGARTQQRTWTLMRALLRRRPQMALRLLLRDLTTLPVDQIVNALTPEHRALLLALFSHMDSGAGFAADLRAMAHPDRRRPTITQPTLVIASPEDGAVPFAHARSLTEAIPTARLVTSRAPSHFIWLGPDYPAIATAITEFLQDDVN